MKRRLANLGNVWHIRIRVHPTWYVAVVLITAIIVTQLPGDYPFWQRIALGVFGSLLYFFAVVIRQFIISLVSLYLEIPLKNVTLYVIGGLNIVPEDVTGPGRELIAAVTGLALNVVIAAIFQWVYLKEYFGAFPAISELVRWSAFFWYILAIIHLLPGMPLEVGRILLAALWKATGRYGRAAAITTRLGRAFGWLMVLGGLAMVIFRGETINGLMVTFLGWAWQNAAAQSRSRIVLLQALRDTTARHIIDKGFPPIEPWQTIEDTVFDFALATGQDYLAVAENGTFLGVVPLDKIKSTPKERWKVLQLRSVMIPARKVKTVKAEQPASHVIEQMDQSKVNEIPVLDESGLIGVAVRDSLTRLAAVRARLKI